MDELATGSDGTAVSAALPVLEQGYYLLEHTAPAGYVLATEKTAAPVKEGETTEITLINMAVEKPTPPAPESKPGKLLVIKKAEKTGTLLKGAVFGVYRASDDKRLGELTTDRYGEAALELAAGEYYLRELEAPAGFRLDGGRIAFRIKSDETKEITVTNKQEASTAGSLLVIKKSEDGKPLSSAVFGVYDAATREKLEEITGSYPGVEKSYALQAGREVRVMVKPEEVTEDNMILLAHDLAKKIEAELEYPGQIKVNVIRETKAVEYAK